MIDEWCLALYLFSSIYMAGLIWFVQIVHYPLFETVQDRSGAYYRSHAVRTGWVTMPPMLVQAACALWFAFRPGVYDALILRILLAAVVLVWVVTFMLSVPQHNKLARGYDAAAVQKLVHTNWLRTFLWTGHATGLLYLVLNQRMR